MILCLGTTPALSRSFVLERLTVDEVNRATTVADYAAGKANNVARVLRTLAQPALAMGFAGGRRGAAMRADLGQAGIAHDFITTAGESRLCVTVIDQANHTATELVEESPAVETRDLAALQQRLSARLSRGAELLVLSGSLAPNVPTSFYRDCVQQAAAAGVRTIIDAAGEPLALALEARPLLVKPNRAELAKTLGREISTDADLQSACAELVQRGATYVVVTLGAAGAALSDGQTFTRLASPKITPVSAIGSGDAFAAGLAAGIVQQLPLPDTLKLAIACGAANALTDRAGHLNLDDVRRFQR